MASNLPTIRWGIVATGMISSWLVHDLLLERKDAKARHIIQSIGSSSKAKGDAFVQKHLPSVTPAPKVYGSYAEVYADPDVDIVYIGTPHSFHKANCLDAIAAGKNVLCEKAFTITAAEAREVLEAARKKGVFVMEAMRLPFCPLTEALLKVLRTEKAIGDVHRVFCDLGLDMDIAALGPESRLRNPALGAGSLLDIGVYSLTWARLVLDPNRGAAAAVPTVRAVQTLLDGVDTATSVLLDYPTLHAQAIVTSSTQARTPTAFCRIEGTTGFVTVEGVSASLPSSFTVYPKIGDDTKPPAGSGKHYEFAIPGFGMYWEADAAACAVAAGKLEDDRMPWEETIRVMEIMDEARRQGGARFPQDGKL